MNTRARFAELLNPEDVLDSLWRVLTAPHTTMLLLIIIAALVCVATLIPQRPAEAVSDPSANSLWLVSVRESYGTAADWFIGLRLVDARRSVLLRGLTGLLTLNLLLGLVDLIDPRHLLPPSRPPEGQTLTASTLLAETPQQFFDRVKEALRAHRYRLLAGSSGSWLYADRFILFVALAYIGLLLTIGGLALSERTAWWEEDVTLRPGQVRPVGHGTGLALRAEVSEGNDGLGSGNRDDEPTELIFLREDQKVGQTTLRDHAPASFAGLWFYPTSTEPVLLVQAQDSEGRNLALQTPQTGAARFTQVELRFREDDSPRYLVVLDLRFGRQLGRRFEQKPNEQYVIVPIRDLSVRLVYNPPGPAEAAPTFQVEAFRGSETSPFYQHLFTSKELVEIAGDRYTFEPQRYAVIRFGRDPGLAIIFIGAILTLAGMSLSAGQRLRRLWVVAHFAEGEAHLHFTSGTAGD
ncbi:MAG: hypothetical protein AMJ93_00980, partial [Anaerolineae bacterium SM23_84]